MPPGSIEVSVLEYIISAGFPLPLPRIIQNNHKKHNTGIKMHNNSWNRLLLMSFTDRNQLESLSDISNNGQHRDKICLVEDPEKQALLAWGFDAWGQLLQSGGLRPRSRFPYHGAGSIRTIRTGLEAKNQRGNYWRH